MMMMRPSLILRPFTTLQNTTTTTTIRRSFATTASRLQTDLEPDYTPGQALRLLQSIGAKGNFIKRNDIRDLCRAARSNKPKDAIIIKTALKDFKRCSMLTIDVRQGRAALQGMTRALLPYPDTPVKPLPSSLSQDEWDKICMARLGKREYDAAMFALKAVLDEDTGLKYSAPTVEVDRVLDMLHSSILLKQYLLVQNDNKLNNDEEMEQKMKLLRQETLNVTQQIFNVLQWRASNPEQNMKKRAARKHRKLAKVVEGASINTLKLLLEIYNALDGSSDDADRMLQHFKTQQSVAFDKEDSDASAAIIESVEVLVQTMKDREAEAAAAADEADVESGEADEE